MRYLLIFLMLFASTCLGQEIKGPDQVQAGQLVAFQVIGADASEVDPAIFPVTDDSFAELVQGKTRGFLMVQASATAGTYDILLVGNKVLRTGKRITVGGGVTPPNPPGPGPDPTPTPGQKYQIMFFCPRSQRDNLPQAQQAILSSLTLHKALEAKGHIFKGLFDPNSVGPAGVVPAEYAPWFDSVKGDTHPRIAIAPKDGGTIVDLPLPKDEAGLWKLLETGKESWSNPVDEKFMLKYHWRLSPGTCRMLGCAIHGGGWKLEEDK